MKKILTVICLSAIFGLFNQVSAQEQQKATCKVKSFDSVGTLTCEGGEVYKRHPKAGKKTKTTKAGNNVLVEFTYQYVDKLPKKFWTYLGTEVLIIPQNKK